MNFFELMGLPLGLELDNTELRNRYLALSRQFHPDFSQQVSDLERTAQMGMSAQVNEAYHTLRDPERRLGYIFRVLGLSQPEADGNASAQLTPDFLMEMMELNEQVQEAEQNPTQAELLTIQLEQMLRENLAKLEHLLTPDSLKLPTNPNLTLAYKLFLERKYLLRIKAQLSTFALR